MPDLILALLPYAIAFAAGYGIREFISRRRRAAARKEYLQKQEEEEAQTLQSIGTLGRSNAEMKNPRQRQKIVCNFARIYDTRPALIPRHFQIMPPNLRWSIARQPQIFRVNYPR